MIGQVVRQPLLALPGNDGRQEAAMIVYFMLYGFIGLIVLSGVARLLLVGLTALYIHRLATHGPRRVTVLGWAVLLLSYLTFRQPSGAAGLLSEATAGAVGGLAGSIATQQRRQHLLDQGYPVNQAPGTLSGRIDNGNRLQ